MHTYNTVRLIIKTWKITPHTTNYYAYLVVTVTSFLWQKRLSPDTLFIEVRGLDNARDVRLPIHYINIPLYKLHPIEFVIHLVSFIWYFPFCYMDMLWQKDCYMFPYYQCNWTFVCQSYFLKSCITFWQFTSIIYQRLHILLNILAAKR